ncbi:hypothetical protein [Streptomyces sp. NPDC006668]|uniref:hypothetical protein n=1 Tax=Streptomyces sp. NPDC006668 TaxID=3156903 RepID=UPI0033CBEC4B
MSSYAVDGDVAGISSADITRAVVEECASRSVGAGQYFVAALRAFLRFCHVEGLISADLSAAALAVTGRRPSLLPQGIPEHDVAALLRACDRRHPLGRRDYAVVLDPAPAGGSGL